MSKCPGIHFLKVIMASHFEISSSRSCGTVVISPLNYKITQRLRKDLLTRNSLSKNAQFSRLDSSFGFVFAWEQTNLKFGIAINVKY